MRWMATVATAGLAELAAHFLSLTWGFMVLLAAFIVVAVRVTSMATAATSKSALTEQRVNGVVTQLGTTNSNVTAVTTTANNALPKTGGTVSGALTVSGNHTVNGNFTANSGATVSGGLSSDTLSSSGSTTAFGALGVHGNSTLLGTLSISGSSAMPVGGLSGVSAPPTGGSAGSTIAGSQFCGSFFTGSGAATWAQDISNRVDAIVSLLSNTIST